MKNKKRILEEGGLIKEDKNNQVGVRLLVSFILTIMLVIAIVVVRNKLTEKEEEFTVIKTKQEIPLNVVITEDNYMDYLIEDTVPQSQIPEDYLSDYNQLIGQQFLSELSKNTMITSKYIMAQSDILKTMKNPIIAGVSVKSTSNMVNGILRNGDIVDLVFYENFNTMHLIQNVYIAQVFDANGEEISRSDKESTVAKINVYVEADYALQFAQHLQEGTLYINKVDYDTSQKLFITSKHQNSQESGSGNDSGISITPDMNGKLDFSEDLKDIVDSANKSEDSKDNISSSDKDNNSDGIKDITGSSDDSEGLKDLHYNEQIGDAK